MHLHPLRISIKFLHLVFYETLCCNRQLPEFKVTHMCSPKRQTSIFTIEIYFFPILGEKDGNSSKTK